MAEYKVRSEISGLVSRLEVTLGDVVEAGQSLMVLEAMKMEIPVEATAGGRVVALHVAAGDSVEEDQVLATIAD